MRTYLCQQLPYLNHKHREKGCRNDFVTYLRLSYVAGPRNQPAILLFVVHCSSNWASCPNKIEIYRCMKVHSPSMAIEWSLACTHCSLVSYLENRLASRMWVNNRVCRNKQASTYLLSINLKWWSIRKNLNWPITNNESQLSYVSSTTVRGAETFYGTHIHKTDTGVGKDCYYFEIQTN